MHPSEIWMEDLHSGHSLFWMISFLLKERCSRISTLAMGGGVISTALAISTGAVSSSVSLFSSSLWRFKTCSWREPSR